MSHNRAHPNTHVVNVYIHDKPDDLPDAKKLAEKYNLDYDEDEDEANSKDDYQDEKDISSSVEYNEETLLQEMSQQHTTKGGQRMEDLILKLDSKNREIERLCTLLEAVSIVPGADPGKYIEIIDGGKTEIVVKLYMCVKSLL
jgi:hypothetical protein